MNTKNNQPQKVGASEKTKATGRTERFNASVKAGGKTYLPGQPVPIGGDNGISTEDAENIRHNFGDYLGGPSVAGETGEALNDAEIAVRESRIETLEAEKQELEANLREKTDLYDKLVIDHRKLGEDNVTLANRVTDLDAEVAGLKKK